MKRRALLLGLATAALTAGAPGGHLDEQCAMAALEQVKAALQ